MIHVAEDYDIQKRISAIERAASMQKGHEILDFGANERRSFHEELGARGFNVETCDVGDPLPKKKFDLIASYFVFEHIVELDETIDLLAKHLKPDGKMIVEVPDASLYEKSLGGLIGEHQQHFQKSSLTWLFRRHGFSLKRSSRDECSRDFGFLSVFEKGSANEFHEVDSSVVKSYKIGLETLMAQSSYARRFFEEVLSEKSLLCFWGANANLELVIETNEMKGKNVLAIDINPLKRDVVEQAGLEFMSAGDFAVSKDEILNRFDVSSDETIIVITASEHSKPISQVANALSLEFVVFDPSRV